MHPVVLMHGIFGFEQLRIGPVKVRYFSGIEKAMEASGRRWFVPRVHPVAPIRQRAEQARDSILAWMKATGCEDEKLIIIGHSMGGLDARCMISHLGMDEHVKALLTIATPHHGSPLADFWMENRPMQNVALPLLEIVGINGRGGNDLTCAAMRQFNADVPDVPHVRYFSISGACPAARVPLVLQMGYWIIQRAEGENDAMVSVRSAIWGEHLGTWPVHHLHQVNHRFPVDALNKVKNIAPFYLEAIREVEERIRQSAIEGKETS